MVGLGHGHRRLSLTGNRSSSEENRPGSAGAEEDTTVVEPDQGNVLSHIISQLRPGADLSRVVLPTFILEPRSMLERITNFMAHPELLLPLPTIDDPVQRFVSVVKFYLSGWHIKPPGVKKPLNPILGEYYSCYWDYPDNTRGYYISEQTSHHPPKSSYFFMAPEHQIRIDGTLKPRSKFLGNSAASLMEGIAILQLLNRGQKGRGERYILTQPNMYARGILFGKMKYELGDHSFVRCPENNLVADLEFKTKGYFSGGYNVISGAIKNEKTQEVLYELSGMWSGEMYIKDALSAHKELLFDATHAKETPPSVRPLEDQGGRESQKLWHTVTEALKERNHDLATDDKSRIEDMQRAEAAKRAEEGVEWRPRFFRPVQGGPDGPDEGEEDLDWILNAKIDGDTPEAQVKQITSITPIVTGSQPDHQFDIPSWKEDGQPTPAQAPAEHQSQHAQQPPQPQQPQHPQQSQQPQQPSAPPQSNGNDLIDFSDDSAPAQAPPSKSSQPPNDISQAQVSSDPGLQQPLQPQNQSVTNAPPASITAPKVMRLDTDGDVDEFVDADDGLLH